MNFSNYFTTPLEQLIEAEYHSKGIVTTADLDVHKIAALFNIEIAYINGISFSDNEFGIIFLNRYNSPTRQRRVFFHELCHVLRHAGDQRRMPVLLKQLQESDAEMFSLYAAMPFFMIQKMELPWYESEAIALIAKEFQLPEKFALRRFNQIKERINGAEYIAAAIRATSATREPYISEPSIMAMCDSDDYSRPHSLVIEHPCGFDWDMPLHIDIEQHYEVRDPNKLGHRSSVHVLSDDLTVPTGKRGKISINMSRVAWRHGQRATRLILPMEVIDNAINF